MALLRTKVSQVDQRWFEPGIQLQSPMVFHLRFRILSRLLIRHSQTVVRIRLARGQIDVALVRRNRILVAMKAEEEAAQHVIEIAILGLCGQPLTDRDERLFRTLLAVE